MDQVYESARQEAREIMAQAYGREEPARAEVFPGQGENNQPRTGSGVFPRMRENHPDTDDAEVLPHEGENPDGEVYPEEVQEDEELDAYVTDRALQELGQRFPGMDLTELAQNPLFIRFAAGEGRDFRQICENFDAFIDQARALVRSARQPDRRTSSAAPARRVPLSNVQRRELAAWNAANPAYRMSERDYFSRLRG